LSSNFNGFWATALMRMQKEVAAFVMESKSRKCLPKAQNGELLFENWQAWYAY